MTLPSSEELSHSMQKSMPNIALVIGLCSHGLAMARALKDSGAEVHAFEANKSLAGVQTNAAIVHFIADVKSSLLINDIITFSKSFDKNRQIVLFPSNDVNVKVLGENVDKLPPNCLLSWHHCSDDILALLLKNNIEARCKEIDINYPVSSVINVKEDIEQALLSIEFPIIAKPVTPQSSFKALKCDNKQELIELIDTYENDLPILIQHWISGTDKDIFFGALYLEKGKILTSFCGQKLESFPLAMGQTTVAITTNNVEVLAITKQFFAGLMLSGPVSLELKRDAKGRYWVIEPTVGRTDFWADLCVASGCNLLEMEYRSCVQLPQKQLQNLKPTIWFDSEKDVFALAKYFSYLLPTKKGIYTPTFSFLSSRDAKPFINASLITIRKIIKSIHRKVFIRESNSTTQQKTLPSHGLSIVVFDQITDLPNDFQHLFASSEKQSMFLGERWYRNFSNFVANSEGTVKFFGFNNAEGKAVALFPLWLKNDGILGRKVRVISSLTNYYSPLYDFAIDEKLTNKDEVVGTLLNHLQFTYREWDLLSFSPVLTPLKNLLMQVEEVKGISRYSFQCSTNFYHKLESDFYDYFLERPSRIKNTIKRKRKKLDKDTQWNMAIFSNVEQIDQALAQYHEIYHDSWKQNEPFTGFIDGLARIGVEKEWLRLGILTINEEPVACQFWFVVDECAYIYKLAYKEKFKNYSPGTILLSYMIEQTIIKDKIKKIDFLTGEDQYKKDWMSQSRDLFCVNLLNNSTLSGNLLRLSHKLSNIKTRLKAKLIH